MIDQENTAETRSLQSASIASELQARREKLLKLHGTDKRQVDLIERVTVEISNAISPLASETSAEATIVVCIRSPDGDVELCLSPHGITLWYDEIPF
jgi:hypothetical protein